MSARWKEAKRVMPASQKIITKLRERRQIEASLRKMLTVSSELEFRQRAQEIASLGSQVIPTIIGNLDRADVRLLAAMGAVATHLDPEEVIMAMRYAVAHPQRTDRGRLGAMTILERFLGQLPDDDLLARLRDPEGVAISSLEEVLAQVEGSPATMIQYIEGLDQQEPHIVLAVVASLRAMGSISDPLERSPSPLSGRPQRAVEPLRMMAQDVREEIAAEALRALGGMRLPEAAHALQTLLPIAWPAVRPLAERLLRKLQFSGVKVTPLPAPEPDWRALVSPLSGLGQQSVWFIQGSRGTEHARFVNVLLSDRAGAVEAMGHTRVPAQMLPPGQPLGHLHDIASPDGSGAMLMLEASFDVGRRLVVKALAHNLRTQIPVAGPLRLLSPWLWGCSGADSLPPRKLPDLSPEDETLLAASAQLLEHPAFTTWTARSEATLQAAEEALRHPGWELAVWVKRLTGELFGEPAMVEVLNNRLEAMSEWLLLAGDEHQARLALIAARAILASPAQDHLFLQAVVRRDLEWTLQGLKRNLGPANGFEQIQ
jgi:hypothetical protein